MERDHQFLTNPTPGELAEIKALGLDKAPDSPQA